MELVSLSLLLQDILLLPLPLYFFPSIFFQSMPVFHDHLQDGELQTTGLAKKPSLQSLLFLVSNMTLHDNSL